MKIFYVVNTKKKSVLKSNSTLIFTLLSGGLETKKKFNPYNE